MPLDLDLLRILRLDGNSRDSMLNDLHIFEFMKFVTFLNMQATTLLDALEVIESNPEGREFVQILFSGPNNAGHWICVWYDVQFNVLRIYDSLNLGLHKDHKKFISRIFPNNEQINVTYETVQQQQQYYNCGLFAMAFTTSIAFGICPCNIIFDESKMRDHACKMFE